MNRFLVSCECGICGYKWDSIERPRRDGKVAISTACPRCDGTPKRVCRKNVDCPDGRVLVTSEVPASEKQSHILEADW